MLVRGGTLRPPGRRAGNSSILLPRVTRASLKSSSKNRLIWIVRFDVLEACVKNGILEGLERFGARRWTVGEGAAQLTVEPVLKELPGFSGVPEQLDFEEGVRVVTVLFTDLHRYSLVFGSLKVLAETCELPSESLFPCVLRIHSVARGFP